MSIDQLYEKYPKSMKVVHTYLPFGTGLKEPDLKKIAYSILTFSPRFLYEVFDDNSVFISIVYSEETKTYRGSIISTNDGELPRGTSSDKSDTREACEKESFELAFKLLEEKL